MPVLAPAHWPEEPEVPSTAPRIIEELIELRVYKVQLDFNGPSATNGIPELLKSMVRPQPLSGSCPR